MEFLGSLLIVFACMNVFMFGFTDLPQNINCRITDEVVALSGSIPRDLSISV